MINNELFIFLALLYIKCVKNGMLEFIGFFLLYAKWLMKNDVVEYLDTLLWSPKCLFW